MTYTGRPRKWTDRTISMVKEMYRMGWSKKDISKYFGLSDSSTIRKIVTGKYYR